MTSNRTKTPKILIVDDEAAVLDALGMFLRQEGYSVEAIKKFDKYVEETPPEKLPDLFIMDILLNQEDGLKITSELKKNPKTNHLPVIVISALPGSRDLATKAGADAFLAKPFDVEQLNGTIERFIKAPTS